MNLNDIASKNEFKEEHGDKYRKQKKKKDIKIQYSLFKTFQEFSELWRANYMQ